MSTTTITTTTCDGCGCAIGTDEAHFILKDRHCEVDDLDICKECRDGIVSRRITSPPPPPLEKPTPPHDPRKTVLAR